MINILRATAVRYAAQRVNWLTALPRPKGSPRNTAKNHSWSCGCSTATALKRIWWTDGNNCRYPLLQSSTDPCNENHDGSPPMVLHSCIPRAFTIRNGKTGGMCTTVSVMVVRGLMRARLPSSMGRPSSRTCLGRGRKPPFPKIFSICSRVLSGSARPAWISSMVLSKMAVVRGVTN
eukprot:9475821-Pyramimonas_sp.AAC.2